MSIFKNFLKSSSFSYQLEKLNVTLKRLDNIKWYKKFPIRENHSNDGMFNNFLPSLLSITQQLIFINSSGIFNKNIKNFFFILPKILQKSHICIMPDFLLFYNCQKASLNELNLKITLINKNQLFSIFLWCFLISIPFCNNLYHHLVQI